ncbi:MAG TPA: isoaspartyl peptidase/L-asparaginase [Steroidobacteraceae bacterium]|nr:isoaspartyl peptidase/L-asparaginase [Steroidobacteraceae bacterium]
MHAIAVHGGAGDIPPSELTSEREREYRDGLERALRAGQAVLAKGGPALDAVVASVAALEDDPLFNAGRGAVLAANGACELDASLMDGRDLRAGAVTGLRHVRSPIGLARLVMERSPHVMLAGPAAEEFALEQGLEPVPNRYFVTARRERQLEDALRRGGVVETDQLMGTVGAVARDEHGNLAAATSTGGMTAKRWGRVGDSPIIGAGTYAANDSCAVSATGHGEFFIRAVVGHEIASLIRHAGKDVVSAAETVVLEQLVHMGGEGGVIAIGRDGRIAMPFNSKGMLRGSIDGDGRLTTGILR